MSREFENYVYFHYIFQSIFRSSNFVLVVENLLLVLHLSAPTGADFDGSCALQITASREVA
jgi:hypothetical protein